MRSTLTVLSSLLVLSSVGFAQSRHPRTPTAQDLAWLRSLPQPATTISDVIVDLNGVATDIGDIEAVHAPEVGNARTIMTATFTLAPAHTSLRSWLNLHWVQVISADACPTPFHGRRLPAPLIDPPLDGWDYMYLGPGRTNPDFSIPDYGWFLDAQPWYWNATGEGANFVPGVSYGVGDKPVHCGGGGITTFKTWLVAEGPGKTFCLLRGFRWTISTDAGSREGPTDLGAPTAAHAAEVGAALTGSLFAGWACNAGCPFDLGYDALVAVDDATRRVGVTFKLNGPAAGIGAIYMASSAGAPIATPFGRLHLDPASLQMLALVPLNGVGYAELGVWLPADVAAGLQVATQGVVAGVTGARLTNYALIGAHYAPGLAWELLASRYNSAFDHFHLLGRGRPGQLLDVTMQNGAGPRQTLGSVTVPPLGMFAFGYQRPGSAAPGTFEVKNGARTLVRLQ